MQVYPGTTKHMTKNCASTETPLYTMHKKAGCSSLGYGEENSGLHFATLG